MDVEVVVFDPQKGLNEVPKVELAQELFSNNKPQEELIPEPNETQHDESVGKSVEGELLNELVLEVQQGLQPENVSNEQPEELICEPNDLVVERRDGPEIEEIVWQPFEILTRKQAAQAKLRAIDSYRCVVLKKIDKFCYICGQLALSKARCSLSPTVKLAYEAYFGREMEHLDKWWTPKVCCSTCSRDLGSWYKPCGKNVCRKMKFGVPMVWREPENHDEECYFCLTEIFGVTRKSRNSVKYAKVAHVTRTIPHSEQYPIPESPNLPPAEVIDLEADGSNNSQSKEPELLSTEPRFFKQEDLNQLFRDLAPISQQKREIITSRLREMNLLDVRRSDRVRQSMGPTRKRYSITFPKLLGLHNDGTVSDDNEEDESANDSDYAESVEKRQKMKDPDFVNRDDVVRQPEKIITISLSCPVVSCGTVWSDKDELDIHLKDAHLVLKYRCFAMGCASSFDSKPKLKAHSEEQHTNASCWQCGRCLTTKPFRSQQDLYFHIRTFHQIGHYKCGIDQCKFEARNANRQVLLKHQYNPQSPHCEANIPCTHPGCDKMFISTSWRNEHAKIHEPEKYKNFQCPQCVKKFWSKCDLDRHLLVHAGIKPFQCNFCGKYFTLKGSMDKHIKSQHSTC